MTVIQAQTQDEISFTITLINAIKVKFPETAPTREQIEDLASELAGTMGYTGSLDGPIDEALVLVDSRMGLGVSLVNTEANHDEEWVHKRQDINWVYSNAYKSFLSSRLWSPNVVQSLNDVSDKILGLLQNPHSEGKWDRRGLVVGHVQSGKTANYIGLITKAADAGYKFIIVIAGIHNSLRKQTQERIDEGFIGRTSNPSAREIIGVGLDNPGFPHPATLTSTHNDFKKTTADQSGWSINDFSKPIILVIKKNVSTLTSLSRWLRELNTQGNGQISDVPMLLIDDEADNASINTNKAELDPTKTNSMIRDILSLFDKSCFVGYTATPFANIFINPDAYDEEVHEELFPKDFIYSLEAPNTYFGADKVFLNDETSDRIINQISDAENYIPQTHKKDHDIHELPESLHKAILQFLVVRAIRNLRGHKNKHCSMMINVSRFVSVQRTTRDFVSTFCNSLKNAIKSNYLMSDEISQKNKYMQQVKATFEQDFPECEFDWITVKKELNCSVENIRTYVINSRSDEVLDYKKYEKDGTSLTAIAVGGLSLSRGLTIEGLSISYMYRNTRMYDTLMQMGRWFGYRSGYEDLCRVHLSRDSIDWYSHIAESTEDLREQIKQMHRDGLSPREFGLYVRSHPDSLLVTAPSKMRTGEKITVKHNFSGKILESYILPKDDDINQHNNQVIKRYLKSGYDKGANSFKRTTKGWFASNVQTGEVEKFLDDFKVHREFVDRKSAAIRYLKSISDRYSKADVLMISIEEKERSGDVILGPQSRESARLKDTEGYWRVSKDRVASRGDEKLGLSKDQVKLATENAKKANKNPSDFHFREVRDKPLLMIHILDLGTDSDTQKSQTNTPAFGISFPSVDFSEGIDVIANAVWINQLHGEDFDSPDEEEDFDVEGHSME